MGNSEGCVCMRSRYHRSHLTTNWRPASLTSLESLHRKGYKWAESLYGILLLWDTKFDVLFTNPSRWQFFLQKDCDREALKYHTNPTHKNLFKDLELDLKDSRNPIGALIIEFSQSFTSSYLDEIRGIVMMNNKEQANALLTKMTEEIGEFADIVREIAACFYQTIGILLMKQWEELKGLLITQLVSGELYRLVYDLATVMHRELGEKVVEVCAKIGEVEIDRRILHILRQVAISESPYEKAHYLFGLKNVLISKDIQEEAIDLYVWKHVFEAKIRDIFIHLRLIDTFAIEPIDSTFDYFFYSLSKL